MKDLVLVGIGTGDPGHITQAGIAALRGLDGVLLPEKGPGKDDLADVRRDLLVAVAPDLPVYAFPMPVRDPNLPYAEAVARWHDAIAKAWAVAAPKHVARLGLLVWGDPSLYDSTLRIAARLSPAPNVEVVPGITALQALTAAFAMPLNEINAPVQITTGRRLREDGWPEGVDRLAVMLDGECSFRSLDPTGLSIWWGAYLGLPNQILRQGPLAACGPEIVELRAETRSAHGWIMDTYILSRTAR
ncbi:MAG: precorrin-6A synthase (deacetylating) [Pseudomonadota bacterium]